MNLSIIGGGRVGSALAQALGRAGHSVLIGARNPNDQEVPIADAIRRNEVIIVAVPFKAVRAVLSDAPVDRKIVIDATNPIGVDLPQDMSGAEQIQEWFPLARVVKCFNQTGAENMGDAHFVGGSPCMFAASNDEEARKVALRLAADAGFEAHDAGPLQNARSLEALARLWIHLAYSGGLGRSFAFGILRR